jgi:hypothetical protein
MINYGNRKNPGSCLQKDISLQAVEEFKWDELLKECQQHLPTLYAATLAGLTKPPLKYVPFIAAFL